MKRLTKVVHILLIAVFFFYLGRQSVDFLPKERVEPKVDLSLFWDVWERLEKNYVDQEALKPEKMVYGAISGMVSSLGDPYTVFLPPSENKQVEDELRGSFEGIGIQFGFRDSKMVVIAPLKGTPAERAGLRAGDLILKIDGVETRGMSLPEAQRRIKGPKGTKVVLTILSEGEKEPRDVEIIRGVIVLRTVEVEWRGKVAIIKVFRFNQQTNRDWEKEISTIVFGRKQPEGIVLDLRDNPGGYLSSAVYVAGEFLERGEVVALQEKRGKEKGEFRVDRKGRFLTTPLVVLVNKGTASASEILAGALQEKGRAKLVGEKTFGKGSIQEVEDLRKGAGLHITVAHWLLPSGKSIEKEGLKPDFEVKRTKEEAEEEKDFQLEKALELLSS